jgi:hypothetical protein
LARARLLPADRSRAGCSGARLLRLAPVALAGASLLASASPLAAQKRDIVTLTNGSRIRGEVKALQQGKLKYSTDPAGTIFIQWDSVAGFTSDQNFEVEIATGERLFGELNWIEGEPRFRLTGETDTLVLAKPAIVGITPVKGNFWKRWSGSLELGFNLTQQNSALYLSLGGSARYRDRHNLIDAKASSFLQSQDSVSATERDEAELSYSRFFKRTWFGLVVLSFDRNSQLNLDARFGLGAGGGRSIIHTNRVLMVAWLGLSGIRETYVATEPVTSADAVLAWRYALYTYGRHETSFTAQAAVLPSLTIANRVRFNLEVNFRREFFKDFYFGVGAFETYDSNPQGVGAKKNDFGVDSKLGWSF